MLLWRSALRVPLLARRRSRCTREGASRHLKPTIRGFYKMHFNSPVHPFCAIISDCDGNFVPGNCRIRETSIPQRDIAIDELSARSCETDVYSHLHAFLNRSVRRLYCSRRHARCRLYLHYPLEGSVSLQESAGVC